MLANRKEPVRGERLNTEEQQILSLGRGFEGVRRRQNPAEDKSTTPSSTTRQSVTCENIAASLTPTGYQH